MFKKVSGFIMFVIGCIMIAAMTVFLFYYNIIQKQSVSDNVIVLYVSYFINIMFISFGYSILDDAEKKEKDTK